MKKTPFLPRRIAFALHPRIWSGAEWASFRLMRALKRDGRFSPAVVFLSKPSPQGLALLRQEAIPAHVFQNQASLARWLKAGRISLLQTSYDSLFPGWAARRAGIPHVWVQHMAFPFFRDGSGRSRSFQRKKADAMLAFLTDARVTVTPWIQKRMAASGLAPVEVIRLGIPSEDFSPTTEDRYRRTRAEHRLSSDDFLIASPGAPSPDKRQGDLLAALKILRRDRLPARLVLAPGRLASYDPPARRYWRRITVQGQVPLLRTAVRSWPPQKPIRGLYDIADVVVITAENEAEPLSLLEAMACGKAVIGVSSGGIPDLIRSGRNGLLVPPRSPLALAKALRRLYRTPSLRRRLGRCARRDIVRSRSMEEHVRRFRELYTRVLKATP